MSAEITQISWWSRIKDAFFGVFFGLILLVLGIIILFWNENNSIKTKLSLLETEKKLISVPVKPIMPDHNEKVVYMTGFANTKDTLTDDLFSLEVNAINLSRDAQMYQWQEKKQTTTQSNTGGSQTQTTTYEYNKVWSTSVIDSSKFKEADTHSNPSLMPVQSNNQYASDVSLGDFSLPHDLITKISNPSPITLTPKDLKAAQKTLGKKVSLNNNQVFVGKNPDEPQIGDLHIQFSAIYPQNVSLIAEQINNTFEPYAAKAGEDILILQSGTLSATQLINNELANNESFTWIMRVLSLIMLILGLALLLNPLVVLADVIPFLGSFLGFGTFLISVVGGLSLWTILTATAWFVVRPFLSIGVIALVVAIIFFLQRRKRNAPSANQ